MKRITWLILTVVIVSVMLIVVNTGLTTSYFTDAEQSTDDVLRIGWGLITLDDGFEDTPWDHYWDENGTTTWVRTNKNPNSGSFSAKSNKNSNGFLTSDEIDASSADNIIVAFWFNPKAIEPGDIVIEIYNGITWATWYDLTDYSTFSDETWSEFNEVITDSQYFISGFRIRFNSSGLTDGKEQIKIDDVQIITNQ